MRASGRALAAIAMTLVAVASGPAVASTFTISPIRVELGAAQRTCVLTLKNADDDPVVIQVRVAAWSQDDGEERLVDSREVLATPPVLQIAGNGEKVVRVALRRDPDPARELTYRLVFEEVPQAAAATFNGLRVALRLSVPVFVAPMHGTATAVVAWTARPLPGGDLEVTASNAGTGHLQIVDFDLSLPGERLLQGRASKYVLPQSHVVWDLKAGSANSAGPMVVHGHSDRGEFSAAVAVDGP